MSAAKKTTTKKESEPEVRNDPGPFFKTTEKAPDDSKPLQPLVLPKKRPSKVDTTKTQKALKEWKQQKAAAAKAAAKAQEPSSKEDKPKPKPRAAKD